MDTAILSTNERQGIESDRWFAGLSPSLRHEILGSAYIRRYKDDGLIAARGDRLREWSAVASGAVRVCSTSIEGRQLTLTYLGPGVWFGATAIFDGGRRTHDTFAHGDTTLLCVAHRDVMQILSRHVELYDALLRLQARRMREMFDLVEDLKLLPLRARLAKQLLHLLRGHGIAAPSEDKGMRIGLRLAQERLAQLLGASRQRVNQALKALERTAAILIEREGIVVRNREALARLGEAM